MKKLSSMNAADRKKVLISAAKDINESPGFEPEIKVKGVTEAQLKNSLKEAGSLLLAEDEVSDDAQAVLAELGFLSDVYKEAHVEEGEAEEVTAEEIETEEEPEEEPEEEKEEAPKTKAKDKEDKAPAKKGQIPMARYVDGIVEKGGTWNQMSAKAKAEGERRGLKQKYTEGYFKFHINYREKEEKGWLKGLGMEITEKGVYSK